MRVRWDPGRDGVVWLIGGAAACGSLIAGGTALLFVGAVGRAALFLGTSLLLAYGLYRLLHHRAPGEAVDIDRVAPAPGASRQEVRPGVPPESEDHGGFGDRLHQGIAAGGAPARLETGTLAPPLPVPPPAGPTNVDEARREVYALYDIAQTLGSSLRLAEVLDLLVSKIGHLIPYRTCAVYLRDDEKKTLEARLVAGDNAAALRGRILLPGEGVTGLAAAQGQAQFSNTSGIELDGTSVDPVDYSIVAAFPLCHDGTVLGVITLLFGRGAACPDSYLRLMDIIARLSAGAVFHSSLVDGGGDGPPSDDLTGLPSPRHLTRFFDQERIRSEQSGRPLALLVMDLDEFRKINDRFGHQGGDRYLAEVSRVLRDHLRHRDILVRMSGNTFAALLPATGFAAAALLAGRLQHAVDLFSLKLDDGGSARAGLSAGIAIYPQDGEELEDLLPRADANMYLNKKSRKNAPDRPATNVIPFPTQFPG